jgi:hypothetical protein
MEKSFSCILSGLLIVVVVAMVPGGCSKSPARKQIVIKPLTRNTVELDSGRVRVQIPLIFSEAPELLESNKNVDTETLRLFVYEDVFKQKYTLIARKCDYGAAKPMEIAFVEDVVKFYVNQEGAKIYHVMDFGINDFKGKRYRYQIVSNKTLNKMTYYFMENDNSRYIYELALVQFTPFNQYSDSLITNIAHSFEFTGEKKLKIMISLNMFRTDGTLSILSNTFNRIKIRPYNMIRAKGSLKPGF